MFADTVVSKRDLDCADSRVRFREVIAHVVLALRPELPAGTISRNMRLGQILDVVAASFGQPLTCHPECKPAFLYSGDWDGKTVDVKVDTEATIGICGSFSLESHSASLVWAFNLARYRRWVVDVSGFPQDLSVSTIELDRLRGLLAEGFQAGMILLDVDEQELREKGAPDVYFGKEVKGLLLSHPDGRKLKYCLTDPEAIQFAQSLVDEQNAVIGYDLCVYCSVVGPQAIHGRTVCLDNVVGSLRETLGWTVAESKYPNVMEVSFKIESNDTAKLERHLDEVRKASLLLSLKNEMGFVVDFHSPGVRHKGQPFSFKWGLLETVADGIQSSDVRRVERIWTHEKALIAALALQTMYSQVTDTARIMAGWRAIEDIFGSKPEHLLDKSELRAVLKAISRLDCLSDDKQRLLKTKLTDRNLMAKEGRNERIARDISNLLGEEYASIYDRIKTLAQVRGKRVHTSARQVESIDAHVEFVKRVLHTYIDHSIQQ